MLPGPVFRFELRMTARRGRFYVLRSCYALLLLAIFWLIHYEWSALAEGELTPREMTWFALTCFGSVAIAQVVLVLILTPGLVAGVIADEKQRKTLHYLLASRLSGPEIVLGKLMARMLYVGVLVAVGFPVLSLLVLLGGIDPMLIVLACGAAASTAWVLASLSVWVSTISRRVREALFITYGLEFLWLFIPLMFPHVSFSRWPRVEAAFNLVLDGIAASNPVGIGRGLLFSFPLGADTLTTDLLTMIAIQAVVGLLLALLAAMQLRPVFQAQEGEGGLFRRLLRGRLRSPGTRRPVRLRARPAPGDRPMLWKELFTSRARGFARFVGLLVTVIGGGYVLYYSVWFGLMAFQEMREQAGNIPIQGSWYGVSDRWIFLTFLQGVVPLLYIVGILNVSGAAAASITSEHEEDTWTSLTATDLSGREIILSKLLGALWRPRMVVTVILLMAIWGVIVGSAHPLSLPMLMISLAIYGWFVAALGVCISLFLRSTWRAQFLTTSILLLVNITGQCILSNAKAWAPMLWPGFTPYEISRSLFSPQFPDLLRNEAASWRLVMSEIDHGAIWSLVFSLLSLAIYLAGSVSLTLLALRQFERVAGRARRSRRIESATAAGMPSSATSLSDAPGAMTSAS
jgi:ABC-type transport system involved in multi-copper enzyme maturation permease subunit